MSATQITALCILLIVFAIGSLRHVHVGAIALAAALGVGLTLGAESVSEIMRGWPVDLMLILLGMTYLLAVARTNGTLDRLVDNTVRRIGSRKALLPWFMFILALVIAAMGNPLAAMVVIPVAMVLAQQDGRDPVIMALGAINGSLAGCFAPTSLYGILTVSIGEQGGVELNSYLQFGVTTAIMVALQFAAQLLFRQHSAPDGLGSASSSQLVSVEPEHGTGLPSPQSSVAVSTKTSAVVRTSATPQQRATIMAFIVLLCLVVGMPLFDLAINIGVIALALAVTLCLLFPVEGKAALNDVDWSTILLVGGIVTYVAVLQRMGAMESLGNLASGIPWPLVAVLTLCFVGALISAFASTTALLPVVIPLALPLVAQGGITGAGVISALAVSATIVDSMPFSTSGALAVATSSDEARPRVTKALLRWGLTMTVVGPLVTVAVFVLPGYL